MQMQLGVYSLSTDKLLADWSDRVISCSITTGAHGYESCEAEINIPFNEAFVYYQQLGPLRLRVSYSAGRIWEGRIEDPSQMISTNSGLRIAALGQWAAFSDAPYTALWSTKDLAQWRVVTQNDLAAYIPERYQIDLNNRIEIAPQKNGNYANAGANLAIAGVLIEIPSGSNKQIVGISFDYEFICPVNWELGFGTRPTPGGAFTSVVTIAATGALLTGCINISFTAANIGQFYLFYNAASAAYAAETGLNYVRITNVRIVSSIVNRVSTTLTVARTAGVGVTATVGSNARMYIGQSLQIDNGSTAGESVTILSLIGATQFTATFLKNHVIGGTVASHVVYPDEIIKNIVAMVSALNSSQLSSNTTAIQSQAVDQVDALFEDRYPNDIINELIAKSDNQTPPRQWVALVYNDRELIVRPRGSGRAWATDVLSLETVRTLTNLYNSVYAVYNATDNKRKLRTAASADLNSVAKFGITRRKFVEIDTTDATQAGLVRDAVLAQQADPIPRATIELDRIFDLKGVAYPLWQVQADDTLTLRNLPPTIGAAYDKIRTLVIVRTQYNPLTNTLTLDLESPIPDTNIQLARALALAS